MKDGYPTGKADLMTAFMVHVQGLTHRGGTWAMINLPSWMSLKSFEELRHDLLRGQRIVSMVHLGRGIFGSDFGTVAFVVDNVSAMNARGVYRRLFEQHVDVRTVTTIEALFRDANYNRFKVSQADFAAIPGSPIVYWLSEKMRAAFKVGKPMGELVDLLVGLRTGDNSRFMRQWWEVSQDRTLLGCESLADAAASGARWFPYNKGGAFRKWYGNQEHVINWEHDGREVEEGLAERYPYMVPKGKTVVRGQGRDRYFSPSVSWSKISSGAPAFRYYPPGFIFDVAGTSIFAASSQERLALLSFANSQLAFEQLAAIAPTLNFEVGQVAGLPIADSTAESGMALAARAVETAQADWNTLETSWDFERNLLIQIAAHE